MKSKILQKAAYKFKKASPVILSFLASAGVVATTVIAIRDTPKALKLIENKKAFEQDPSSKWDTVKTVWKCYIPTVIVGLSTIGCISASTIISSKNQAALTSAYVLVAKSYRDYKRKVKELYGEEAHQNIVKSLSAEKVDLNNSIYAPGIGGAISTTFDGSDEDVKTFYDVLSGRYFESTIGRVLAAEYAFNRNFNLGGMYAELDDYYSLLGLDVPHDTRVIGWNCDEECTWIEFNNYVGTLEDGMQIHYIELLTEPHPPEYFEEVYA